MLMVYQGVKTMSKRSRRKKTAIYAAIGAVCVALFACVIGFVVYEVGKIFGEKPIEVAEQPTKWVEPSPTPEPWDPDKKPEITHIVANVETLSLNYERVPGAAGYEISFRSEAGEWQQEISKETYARIKIHSGFTYHVEVRSLSPSGEKGPASTEAIISSEAVRPVVTMKASNDYSATLAWPFTREGANYVFSFRAAGETAWHEFAVDVPQITIGGLVKGNEYEVMVAAIKEDFATLRSDVTKITPGGTDYGDPFLNVRTTLKVGQQSKLVGYTAENGCLGVQCWAQFKTVLFTDVELNNIICDVPGGTPLVITADADGNYVCERDGNRFSVHVKGTISGEEKEGWILGNAMFVDLAMIFPMSNQYSIQYNRTNAYASIFTCGGNGMEVDIKSKEETRYDPLKAKDGKASLEATGYNEIKDVTGKKLPNYGSKDQMPAVWDVALQLLTAQRNALARGRCLLIYEAYRPNSTSKKVYSAMTGNAYFKEEIEIAGNKLTLANGFLNKNYTEAYFIANNSKHNLGIALDLTIMKYDSVDKLGKEIEMQTKMHTLDYRCDMTYNGTEAKALYDIMTTGTGLIPLVAKQEWWHFELSKDSVKFPCVKEYVYANYQI